MLIPQVQTDETWPSAFGTCTGFQLSKLLVVSATSVLNKWVLACCSSRQEGGLGPFPATTGLGETAEQVAGNPLPEAQPHCSGLATGLAACCIHLAAVCIPSPSSWLPAKACDGSRAQGGSQPQVLKIKNIKSLMYAKLRNTGVSPALLCCCLGTAGYP